MDKRSSRGVDLQADGLEVWLVEGRVNLLLGIVETDTSVAGDAARDGDEGNTRSGASAAGVEDVHLLFSRVGMFVEQCSSPGVQDVHLLLRRVVICTELEAQ